MLILAEEVEVKVMDLGELDYRLNPEAPDDLLGVEWRTGLQSIGVVAIRTDRGGWKAYVGCGFGLDQEMDVKFIRDWGAKLLPAEASAFFPHLDPATYDDAHLEAPEEK